MRGKISPRVPRKARNWSDIMWTLFYSNASEEEVLAMTPKQRHQAQIEGMRLRSSPGYRSWNAESMAAYQEWAKPWRWGPGAPAMSWHAYLTSINRLDLFRDVTATANGFHCGRCHEPCEVPHCIPGEVRWLCKGCAEISGKPVQAGHFRPRRGL
jgi:hypothetical protein